MTPEEKELDTIMDRAKLHLVPVPDKLEDRINQFVVSKKQRKKRNRYRNYLVGLVAASFLFTSLIISPTAMTYAKDIPLVGKAVNWLEQLLVDYPGIKTAEENNYKPFKPHSFSVGDYELKMDHLFLEDHQLFFTLLIKGGDIAEKVYEDQSGMLRMDDYLNVKIKSIDFELSPSGMAGTMGVRQISGEYYLLLKSTLYLDSQSVQEFMNNEEKTLSFKIGIKENDTNIEIPLSNSKIQLGKHYNQSINIKLNNEDLFTVNKLEVYPTRMVLGLSGGSEEAFLKMVSNKEKPYLKDEHGKMYTLRLLQTNPNDYKLEALSTFYFDENVKNLTLHVDSKTNGVPINITEE